VITSIDRKAWDFADYSDIFISIISERCSDEEENQ
jgi:hypothetical protein